MNWKLEHRVEKAQEEFDAISKSIRKEVERFELQRYHDFKAALITYLESVLKNQQQVFAISVYNTTFFLCIAGPFGLDPRTLTSEIGAGISQVRCSYHPEEEDVCVDC